MTKLGILEWLLTGRCLYVHVHETQTRTHVNVLRLHQHHTEEWKRGRSDLIFSFSIASKFSYFPRIIRNVWFTLLVSLLNIFTENILILYWLVWLSGLSADLRTKGSPVRFPV